MERLWPCMKEDSGEELCLLDEDTFLYSAEVEKLLMCPTFAVSPALVARVGVLQ